MNRIEYDNHVGINFSLLKYFDKSPAHYLYKLRNPQKKTAQMELGTAVHLAAFKRSLFETLYYVFDEELRPVKEADYRNKENANWKAKEMAKADSFNMKIISSGEYDKLIQMVKSVYDNKQAKKIIDGSIKEKEIFWKDNTGVECKAIPDLDWEDMKMACDLKTCDSAHPIDFARVIADKLYFCQGCFYNRGLSYTKGKSYDGGFSIIAVENNAPFCCEVFFLKDSLLALGDLMIESWLNQYRICKEKDKYPSYKFSFGNQNGIIPIDIPSYFYSSIENRYQNLNY